jgi:thiol:disulfide interchange protein
MSAKRWFISLVSLAALGAQAQFSQPYQWSHSVQANQLIVEVQIPDGAYLYADQTAVELSPSVAPDQKPVAHPHTDDFGTSDVYEGGQTHRWVYPLGPSQTVQVSVRYQGCGTPEGGGGAVCYPPASEAFVAGQASASAEPVADTGSPDAGTPVLQDPGRGSLAELLDRFETVRTDGGMKNPDAFLAFLDVDQEVKSSSSILEGKSTWLMILFVLLGGVALNLTPCVLPMIPVNLAIIGAGAEAATKRQGFVRGGVYGLGIALAYGGLGLFAVLTGSKFGTLNASPVFNFIIAAIFVILALAMFDVLSIDLSRFGAKFGVSNEKRGRLIPAFAMGVVAALLAGACVAPIVIAVLLQAATLYAGGNAAGLFLPLLLGVGMALPWPIAGAGLTVLPKPGMWMVKVKHGFGILIILFAAYYAYLGIELLPHSSASGHSTETAIAALEQDLRDALADGRPVFIDFWASWCKNCLTMDATTFKDPAVIERLHDFNEIKFQAEDIGSPQIKALLDRYRLPGLPGYVILTPKP